MTDTMVLQRGLIGPASARPVPPPRWTVAQILQPLAAAILVLAVTFNPLLAIVNGNVHHLSGGIIAATQAALTLGALAVGGIERDRITAWMLVALALFMIFLILSLGRGDLAVKNYGDVLIIPAFMALGTRLSSRTLMRILIGLQAVITVIGVFELLAPDLYATIFKVIDFYVNTRGFDEKEFWAGNNLFLSSQRPGGRLLLNGFGFHRGSSLFLEPVSLGNWTVVLAVCLAGFWHKATWRTRVFLIATNFVLLVVCDGRLAMGVLAFLIVYLPLSRRIPSALSIAYLPLAILFIAGAVASGYLTDSGDNLSGRLYGGFETLMNLDVGSYFGVGSQQMLDADAGWAYFMQTQSILVGMVAWAAITLLPLDEGGDQRMFKHGLALFITACLPVSYSLLSIKTMAVLWAAFGCLLAEHQRHSRATEPAEKRAATLKLRRRPI